jgi:hypothetical protein
MKKFYFLLTVFSFFLTQGMIAQTIIEDGTEICGTWTKAGSPYIVNGMATIKNGDSLIIEPGVEIKLKTGTDYNYKDEVIDVGALHVKGKLKALGTPSEEILFT